MKLDSLTPLLRFIQTLDLNEPAAARDALEREYPYASEEIQELKAQLIAELEAGQLCNKGEDPLRFSRVFKPSEATLNFSSDCVYMNGPGPKHRHPDGEIDLCIAMEGEPRFDGQPEGWVVYGPGSVHIPTVTDGRMLILYLLPNGAFEFVKD